MSQKKNKSKNIKKRNRKIKNSLKSEFKNIYIEEVTNPDETLNNLDNIFKNFLKK